MEDIHYKHFIVVKDGYIVNGWSSGPYPDKSTDNAICINDNGSYQFRLEFDGEENPNLFDELGNPIYKWNGNSIISADKESEEE